MEYKTRSQPPIANTEANTLKPDYDMRSYES